MEEEIDIPIEEWCNNNLSYKQHKTDGDLHGKKNKHHNY